MQYIMDYKNILFLRKNVYLRQRRPKLSPRLGTSRITQWNQILKNFVNDLNEQTELFTVSELHANISSFEEKDLHVYFILRKRFSRQAESFLAFLQYEARMFLKCVLIKSKSPFPRLRCPYVRAPKKKTKQKTLLRRFNSCRKCRWSHLHT